MTRYEVRARSAQAAKPRESDGSGRADGCPKGGRRGWSGQRDGDTQGSAAIAARQAWRRLAQKLRKKRHKNKRKTSEI
jgi:hypothetical protein